MRILYFINGFDPGGAEHGLLTLVESGFFSGHDLRVIGICRGRGGLADALRTAFGEGYLKIVDDREDLTLRACILSAFALAREIRLFRPDVVVLSLKQANVIGRLVLQAFPGPRCVSFEHISRYRARRAEAVYGKLLAALSGRVDEVWSDCEETLEATRPYFRKPGRREAIVPLFRVRPGGVVKTDYSTGTPLRIAAAGRLVDRKNFDRLILAVKVLADQGTPAALTIFGDGPEHERLKGLISSTGLEARVRLAGYRDRWFEEAADSDLFVNASDTEGFCIVVAEAMSVGLPVVATDVGGIREYGRDNENMLKIADAGIEALVAAIQKLAGDEGLRQSLGQQAREDIHRRYSEAGIAERGRSVFGEAR